MFGYIQITLPIYFNVCTTSHVFFLKFDNRDKCIVAFCLMIYFPMIIEKIFPIPSYLYNSSKILAIHMNQTIPIPICFPWFFPEYFYYYLYIVLYMFGRSELQCAVFKIFSSMCTSFSKKGLKICLQFYTKYLGFFLISF